MISRDTGKLKKYLTRWFQTSSRLPSLTVTRTVDAKNSIKKLLCSNLHEMQDMLLQINSTRKNVVIKHIRYNVEQFYRLKTMAPPTDKMTTTSQKNFRRGAKFSRPREVQIWNKRWYASIAAWGYSIHWPLLKILLERKPGTYEVPAVETGLLGELHPVLLQTHQKAADVKY